MRSQRSPFTSVELRWKPLLGQQPLAQPHLLVAGSRPWRKQRMFDSGRHRHSNPGRAAISSWKRAVLSYWSPT